MENNKEELKSNNKNNIQKPMGKKKVIVLVAIILIATSFMIFLLSRLDDLGASLEMIKEVDGKYMTYAGIALGLYTLTYPISLCILSRRNHLPSRLFDDYFIGVSEFFFSAITPFSTGGQPIQIYLFTKRGVNASKSTGIIVTNFISMMIASNIIAIVSLFYYGKFSVNFTGATEWMIIFGFAMNFFVLIFMILMATCKFIRDWFKRILEGLSRLKLLGKYIEKGIPAFDKYCTNAQAAAIEIFSHKKTFILSVITKGISLCFYYSIPYFILKALNVELSLIDLPYVILASAFAITTMVWVPTPGGTGGIEFAFTMIFTTFMVATADSKTIGVSGMLLWRFLTYYLLMFVSLIFYIIFMIVGKEKGDIDD